jgi:hypothetical protein
MWTAKKLEERGEYTWISNTGPLEKRENRQQVSGGEGVDVDKTTGKLEERTEITSNAWTAYQLGDRRYREGLEGN